MPVKFTKHARERMVEREISIEDVFRVLAFGRQNETRWNDIWTINPQAVPDQSWLALLSDIAVVCTKNLQVITVYRIYPTSAC